MTKKKFRVLLIEDQSEEAVLIQSLLNQTDGPFTVQWADDLKTGLALLANETIDAILLDLSLPDSHGPATVQSVYDTNRNVPIIALAGDDEEQLALETMRAGAEDYLIKASLEQDNLKRALRYAIERHRLLAALQANQQRLRGFMDATAEYIAIYDSQLRLVEVNKAFLSLYPKGMQKKDLIGKHLQEITSNGTWKTDRYRNYVQVLKNGKPFSTEALVVHPNLGERFLHITAFRVGRGLGFLSTDVTEQKRYETQLRHSALYDHLTNLPNRALLLDRLGQAINRSARKPDHLFGILFIDLDHFKLINDSLGHAMGDQLLIAVGERFRDCIRPGDTVARLGGDEFAILLDNLTDVSDPLRVANRIHQRLTLPFCIEHSEIFISVSIGIALSQSTYENPEDYLRDADIAMYRAKDQGRSHSEVFDTQMLDQAVKRLKLETDLRRALERDELRVRYQPIIELGTDKIEGFEALVRWQHPERGLIPPADFIPVAEEIGLIREIDHWVHQEAVRQLKSWRSQFPPFEDLWMSVNVSGQSLAHSHFPDQLANVIRQSRIGGYSLVLEITESFLMQEEAIVDDHLSQLVDLGVRIYVDDFGSGYSSLSRFRQYPIDGVKIDRSFIVSAQGRTGPFEIADAITLLAHRLGKRVVAEGIETEQHLSAIRQINCESVQGYYFSRPVDGMGALALVLAEYEGVAES